MIYLEQITDSKFLDEMYKNTFQFPLQYCQKES